MRAAAFLLGLLLSSLPSHGGEFFTLKGHGGPIKGIDISPDGQAILTASFDNSVGLWVDGKPRWLEAHSAAVNTVRFVDDTRAVSAGDDFALYLWDLPKGSATRLGQHKGKVISLAASPNRDLVASASWDGSIGLWPLDEPNAPPRFLIGHQSAVNDVAFSDDGTTLYSASADGSVRVWDVATGVSRSQLLDNGFGVNVLAINEQDGWLAYGAVDGVTRIVNLATGAQIDDLTLERRPILAMTVSNDFRRLAVGDGQGYISIIDTTNWSFVSDFRASFRGPIWSLRFAADQQNVHAGGLDSALYSWPVEPGGDAPKMATDEMSFLNGDGATTNGERQFNRKCSICHTLGPNAARRAGPTLHGIFGRSAGTAPGYLYSDALNRSDHVWSDESIDALFELGPDVYIAGSKMPMQIIAAEADRRDLIEFLKTATRPEDRTR